MSDEKPDNYMIPSTAERMVKQLSAGNVKIVNHPVYGRVYVCPYPRSHASELSEEASKIILGDSAIKDNNKLD